MVITLSKNTNIKELEKKLEKLKNSQIAKPGLNVANFAGKVNFNIDGLEYQKQIRDEWK